VEKRLYGITHDNEASMVKDIQREERLAQTGFKIVRFTDKEVLNNIAGVILELEKIVTDIETSTPLPPPAGDIGILQAPQQQ
jgi:very-short-patch-repair endonuclease